MHTILATLSYYTNKASVGTSGMGATGPPEHQKRKEEQRQAMAIRNTINLYGDRIPHSQKLLKGAHILANENARLQLSKMLLSINERRHAVYMENELAKTLSRKMRTEEKERKELLTHHRASTGNSACKVAVGLGGPTRQQLRNQRQMAFGGGRSGIHSFAKSMEEEEEEGDDEEEEEGMDVGKNEVVENESDEESDGDGIEEVFGLDGVECSALAGGKKRAMDNVPDKKAKMTKGQAAISKAREVGKAHRLSTKSSKDGKVEELIELCRKESTSSNTYMKELTAKFSEKQELQARVELEKVAEARKAREQEDRHKSAQLALEAFKLLQTGVKREELPSFLRPYAD